MPKATWNGKVVAHSDDTVIVENNHYFPIDSLERDCFEESDYQTNCPWKGKASYFDIVVDGQRNAAAAWYYPDPKPAASEVQSRVAFWRGVEVSA